MTCRAISRTEPLFDRSERTTFAMYVVQIGADAVFRSCLRIRDGELYKVVAVCVFGVDHT